MQVLLSRRQATRKAQSFLGRSLLAMALACSLSLASAAPGLGESGACTGRGANTVTKAPSLNGPDGTDVVIGDRNAVRQRLRRALKAGFGVQYWGESYGVDQLASTPHGLLIIEATRIGATFRPDAEETFFTRDEIKRISRNGSRPVIAYLNLTEIEYYRDYWIRHVRDLSRADDALTGSWIGPITEDGEQLAVFWDPVWETILSKRVETLMALGFDGIMFDDVLHYFSFQSGACLDWPAAIAPQPTEGHAMAMMTLVLRLTKIMRQADPAAIAIVNNGVFIGGDAAAEVGHEAAMLRFANYAAVLDAILVESMFAADATTGMRRILRQEFTSRGLSVLSIDFLSGTQPVLGDVMMGILRARAALDGFCPYVVPDGKFDRLAPPLRCIRALP